METKESVNRGDMDELKKIIECIACDKRLSVQSKGIYLYFLGKTLERGVVNVTIDDLLKSLNISEEAYYKYLKPLKESGYIRVEKNITTGRFSANKYILLNDRATE